MANNSGSTLDSLNKYRKCKIFVQTGLKCGIISHKSCLKLLKSVTFLKNNSAFCCDGPDFNQTSVQSKISSVLKMPHKK